MSGRDTLSLHLHRAVLQGEPSMTRGWSVELSPPTAMVGSSQSVGKKGVGGGEDLVKDGEKAARVETSML